MRRQKRRAAGIDVISIPAIHGSGCEWCPCTSEEEAAHPEWHDPNRCPQNCTAQAEWNVCFIARASRSEFSMLVCDEHSVSVKLLLTEKVLEVTGGAR